MPDPKIATKTIEDVFDEFLDDQEDRLSPATFERYATVLDLLESYMERFWPGHDGEHEAVTNAGGTYCGTYGPEDIRRSFVTFLNHYMPHKVVAGEGTHKAAPVVIRKLAKWLVRKGYDPDADHAVG
jgi:hypothetical protein